MTVTTKVEYGITVPDTNKIDYTKMVSDLDSHIEDVREILIWALDNLQIIKDFDSGISLVEYFALQKDRAIEPQLKHYKNVLSRLSLPERARIADLYLEKSYNSDEDKKWFSDLKTIVNDYQEVLDQDQFDFRQQNSISTTRPFIGNGVAYYLTPSQLFVDGLFYAEQSAQEYLSELGENEEPPIPHELKNGYRIGHPNPQKDLRMPGIYRECIEKNKKHSFLLELPEDFNLWTLDEIAQVDKRYYAHTGIHEAYYAYDRIEDREAYEKGMRIFVPLLAIFGMPYEYEWKKTNSTCMKKFKELGSNDRAFEKVVGISVDRFWQIANDLHSQNPRKNLKPIIDYVNYMHCYHDDFKGFPSMVGVFINALRDKEYFAVRDEHGCFTDRKKLFKLDQFLKEYDEGKFKEYVAFGGKWYDGAVQDSYFFRLDGSKEYYPFVEERSDEKNPVEEERSDDNNPITKWTKKIFAGLIYAWLALMVIGGIYRLVTGW